MDRGLTEKRKLVLTVLIVSAMACVGALWWFETATGLISELDSRGYPFLLVIFSAALVANLFLRTHQRTVELICYLGLAFYFA